MNRVLFVGELNPDIVVAGVPAPGGRLRFGQAEDLVDHTLLTLGSSAAITASAAACAGAAAALVAVVGEDDLGQICLAWAVGRGIDVTSVRVAPGRSTGSSVVLVKGDDSSDRQILTDLGTMADLSLEDLPDELIRNVEHVHVSSFFMHVGCRDRLHERLQQARKLGAMVSLDTNDDPTRRWHSGAGEAVAASDILFGNDVELLGLAGLPADGSPSDAARLLLATMPTGHSAHPRSSAATPAVVHKQGRHGATVHTASGAIQVCAPDVAVVDTIGAGDTLAGTVLAAVLRGAGWSDALALGVAAASLSTAAAGGIDGQPTMPDVSRLAATLTVQHHPHEAPVRNDWRYSDDRERFQRADPGRDRQPAADVAPGP